MTSDDEVFNDTVETLTPDRKIQNPGDRFPLRRTPSRIESEKRREARMDEQNLFESLTKRSAATSNPNSAGFAFGGMSSSTAETTSVMKNYTSKEKADRLQEMKSEEANVEREFPNELFDFCGIDKVEEVRLIDIPYTKGKTREEEEHIFNCVKVNELRKKRATIYASITRGEKTLMKMVRSTEESDWEIFHQKLKGSYDTLTQIMDNLNMIGFEKTKGEDEKYLGYTSRLKKMIAKIDHIRATQATNLPGMITTLINQYVKEEDDFCDSLIDPSTGEDWLDDQTRKDAAAAQAKASDFNVRMLRFRNLSAGTSGTPVLTKRYASSGTQGASAQAGSQPGAYAQAGAQFGAQFGGQPPNQFPNPPPQFPQQNFGAQAAAGYQIRPPQANYHGIPKIKVNPFDGEASEYQRFKLSFHAAYDDRHLPPKHLALLLESSLKGRPLTIISEYMRTCIDDLSYDRMWELLEERYGGKNVEDAFTISMFKNAPQIKNGSLKEVERLYDVFSVQHRYYLANDPDSLERERSMLFQYGKEKLNSEFSMKFIRYTDKHDCVPNFTALMLFMKAEFLFAQTREREYSYSSTKSEVHSAKKALERCNLDDDDDDAKALQTLSDAEEDGFPSEDDQYSYYAENQRTGKRYEAKGFRFAQMRPNSFQNHGNGGQKTTFRAIGFGGSQLSRMPRPPQPTSQFKEGQCSCCRQAHKIPDCPKFKNLTIQQQSTIIRRDRLCYHCLEGPHFTRDCKKNEGRKCGIDGCTLYHHRVLHRDPKSSKFIGFQIDDEMEPDPPTADELADVQNCFKISQNGAISIQTLICNVLSGKNKRAANVKTVVLIDSGSSITCIDEDFALEHNLRVLDKREGMTLHMLERIVKLPEDQYHVELQLSSVEQGCTKNISAWTVKNLAKHTSVVDWSERKKQFPHLKDINFPKMPEDSTIKIIMGVDNTALYAPVKIVPNPENDTDPIAIKLSLGWTCVGRSSPSPYKNEVFTNVVFRPKN